MQTRSNAKNMTTFRQIRFLEEERASVILREIEYIFGALLMMSKFKRSGTSRGVQQLTDMNTSTRDPTLGHQLLPSQWCG